MKFSFQPRHYELNYDLIICIKPFVGINLLRDYSQKHCHIKRKVGYISFALYVLTINNVRVFHPVGILCLEVIQRFMRAIRRRFYFDWQ